MKTCMLCGSAAADDAVTCPKDGEASWQSVSSSASGASGAPATKPSPTAPAADESEGAAADSDAAEEPAPKKRGRR